MAKRESEQAISVDELLDVQKNLLGCPATIESVEGKPGVVKITPWVDGKCQCRLAIEVPKTSIRQVTPTGETHKCCGKGLRVVEIQFKEGSTISLKDVFSQLCCIAEEEERTYQAQVRGCVWLHKKLLADGKSTEEAAEAFRACVG